MTVVIGPKKLPKRALDQIARAQAETASWKAKALAATSLDPDGTPVRLSGYGVEPDRGLPPKAIIEFRLGGLRISVYLDDAFCGPSLTIRSSDGGILVHPTASNVIHVTVRP